MSDSDTTDEIVTSEDFADDLAAFQQVAAAFQRLDHPGRLRLLRTIATFFRLDANLIASHMATPAAPLANTAPFGSPLSSFSEDRTPQPKEFLRDKKPNTDVERVAVLAYYLTHFRGMPHFKTVDLSALNTEAAQVKFSNAAQAVDNATKAGLLVPAIKGTKQLSAHGELYVQALPDRAAAKEAIKDTRPKRRRRASPNSTSSASSSSSFSSDEE
jgi:hypothetical protein